MSIDRFQAVIMADNDIFTVSATALILNDTYLTVKRGTDRITYIYFKSLSRPLQKAELKGIILLCCAIFMKKQPAFWATRSGLNYYPTTSKPI